MVEDTLRAGEREGFVIMPGVFKGEKLVEWLGSGLGSSDKSMDKSTANDRKIIEVACTISNIVVAISYLIFHLSGVE